MVDLQKAKEVAVKAATVAGDWLKANQVNPKITKQKDIEDIQLESDLAAEKLIIDIISKDFPDHNIYSEEAGLIDHQSDYTWVVDPLDGTKEYLRGQKDYLSLVELQDKDEPLVGCVYNPNTKETFTGAKGLGAKRDGLILQVSTKVELKNSIITIKLPNPGRSKEWQAKIPSTVGKLLPTCYRVRSSTYDAANICLVALGGVEAFVLLADYGPRWWDVAAAIAIAKEAGTKISNAAGQPFKHQDLSEGLVISNGLIHNQLIELINS